MLVEADASSGSFGTRTFVVNDFVGDDLEGTWRLVVIDVAAPDKGTLKSWSLEVTR
jgi:subtilisin-like proprotein convertase family protein